MIETIRTLLNEETTRILLTVWLATMGCDVVLGILASIRYRRISSHIAMNGIIQKLAAITLAVFIGIVCAALNIKYIFWGIVGTLAAAELQSVLELLHILDIKIADRWIKLVSDHIITEKVERYRSTNQQTDQSGVGSVHKWNDADSHNPEPVPHDDEQSP
jgi:phage-related holin